MEIDAQLAADLGVALNEASLAGFDYDLESNTAEATFIVQALPKSGLESKFPRRQLVFCSIGRIVASLRLGRWDDARAPVENFSIEELSSVVQSFGCQDIYGWEFFNVHQKELQQWGGRLSLDFSPADGSMRNSIVFFQEGVGGDKHLDVCVWFEGFRVYDAVGDEVEIGDFIAGGRRWWDTLFAGYTWKDGHLIAPGQPADGSDAAGDSEGREE